METKLFGVIDFLMMLLISALVFYLTGHDRTLWIGYAGGYLAAIVSYRLHHWRKIVK